MDLLADQKLVWLCSRYRNVMLRRITSGELKLIGVGLIADSFADNGTFGNGFKLGEFEILIEIYLKL